MRDRGIVLGPYLDHGVLVRVCQEVGVPVEELDPSSAGVAQVSLVNQFSSLLEMCSAILQQTDSPQDLAGVS